jgi:hypothetical protein
MQDFPQVAAARPPNLVPRGSDPSAAASETLQACSFGSLRSTGVGTTGFPRQRRAAAGPQRGEGSRTVEKHTCQRCRCQEYIPTHQFVKFDEKVQYVCLLEVLGYIPEMVLLWDAVEQRG